jgi:hypothetical protein
MSHASSAGKQPSSNRRRFIWLEWVTAGVLIAVLLALAWITVAPYVPDWGILPTVGAEVIVFLCLLTAALVLVGAVALLHTRK